MSRIKYSILSRVKAPFCRMLYKRFGRKSLIIHPLLVSGRRNIEIGDKVFIRDGARIECIPNKEMVSPCLVILDNTTIEQNVHITCGKSVIIGRSCSILGGCVITDIKHPYDDIETPASQTDLICNPVSIGDQCFLGMYSVILPGIKLGRHVIVGAHSVVTESFPDNCVVAGAPAKIIKRYDANRNKWVRANEE